MLIINPATEELIREIPGDTKNALEERFLLLRKSQQDWAMCTLRERIGMLVNFSGLLLENIESLASVLTDEIGKPLQQSRNEINGARTRIKWITDNAARYLSDESMTKTEALEEKIVYEPLGVICNISAWNYPYLVGVNVFVPALIAGNAVLYKPSEFATLTGLEIQKLLHISGVPAGVFQVAVGAGDVGELLTDLKFDGFFFTGSYKTGQQIYHKLATSMVPCHCELGGKDPLYVADDVADIAAVASATADGAFYNNGQSCCAVERIYVHEKVYDRYIEEIAKEVKSWKLGLPTEENVYLGPLTRPAQLALLEEQVLDAVSKGATLLSGGKRINRRGNFFAPTLLTNVDHTMSVMKEESFGPIVGIMKVKDDAEAIYLMQDTEFGLTASVYSKSRERAEQILRQVNAGTGYWNCCDRVSAAVPWTGRNHSGFGVALSHAGLRSFVKPKAFHLVEPV